MFDPIAKFKELRIHFEKPTVVVKRTTLAAVVIMFASAAVFGIDTAVSSVMSVIG